MNTYSKTHRGFLAALVTAGLIVSATAGSAATSGSVQVSGTVDAVNDITVSTEAGAAMTSAELVAGVTNQLVSVVNEKNNSDTGYTVTLASTKAGGAQAKLIGVNTTNTINYSISYGGAAVTLDTTGKAVVTAGGTNTGSTGVNKNLAVTTTAGWHNADTYSDTLTLTIASK